MASERAIHPAVVDRLPLVAALELHRRIDAGGLGGKVVLLPWAAWLNWKSNLRPLQRTNSIAPDHCADHG